MFVEYFGLTLLYTKKKVYILEFCYSKIIFYFAN